MAGHKMAQTVKEYFIKDGDEKAAGSAEKPEPQELPTKSGESAHRAVTAR
jgi:hypothetical protein